MKKTMSLYLALGAVAVMFGAWLRWRSNVPFTGFDGSFVCQEFGLPEVKYSTFQFKALDDRVMNVEASSGQDRRIVGRAYTESNSLLRFELAMDMVHSPSLVLNPLAEHFFEGHGDRIELVGRKDGAELYRFRCSKP